MVNIGQLKQIISAVEEGFKAQMAYITMLNPSAQNYPQPNPSAQNYAQPNFSAQNYAQHFPQLVRR